MLLYHLGWFNIIVRKEGIVFIEHKMSKLDGREPY